MDAHKTDNLHWSWLLAFYLLLVVLFFTFGDLLTAIIGVLITSAIFAGYHNEIHKEL